jgi:hypothetical protein
MVLGVFGLGLIELIILGAMACVIGTVVVFVLTRANKD